MQRARIKPAASVPPSLQSRNAPSLQSIASPSFVSTPVQCLQKQGPSICGQSGQKESLTTTLPKLPACSLGPLSAPNHHHHQQQQQQEQQHQQQQQSQSPLPQSRLQTNRKKEALSETDLLLLHESFMYNLHDLTKKLAKKENMQYHLKKPLTTKQRKEQKLMKLFSNYEVDYDNGSVDSPTQCDKSRLCSSACLFFNPSFCKSVYVCVRSGKLHYCTSASCNALETTNESRVCTLTGLCYSLDTYVVLPTHSDFADYSRRDVVDENAIFQMEESQQIDHVDLTTEIKEQEQEVRILAEKKQSKKEKSATHAGKKRKVQEQELEMIDREQSREAVERSDMDAGELDSRVDSASKRDSSTNQTTKRARTSTTVRVETLLCEGRNFIHRLLPSLSSSELQRLSSVCISLWLKIVQTSRYSEIKGRYKYRSHVAAVLYNSLEGIQVDGKTVIQTEPTLYEQLPPSKVLKNYQMKPSAYTNACKFLHELAAELISSKLLF